MNWKHQILFYLFKSSLLYELKLSQLALQRKSWLWSISFEYFWELAQLEKRMLLLMPWNCRLYLSVLFSCYTERQYCASTACRLGNTLMAMGITRRRRSSVLLVTSFQTTAWIDLLKAFCCCLVRHIFVLVISWAPLYDWLYRRNNQSHFNWIFQKLGTCHVSKLPSCFDKCVLAS